MALTTTTQLTSPVNVMFQQQLLRNAKALTPYFVGSMSASISSNGGTFTATWRRIENMTPTTSALTQLSGNLSLPTRNASQPSITDVSATISKYGDFIFLTEEADLINFNGQTAKLVEVLSIQAGRSLNRLQRNHLEDNATLVRPDGQTTDANVNSAINNAVVKNIGNTLNRNDALKFTPQTLGSTNIGTSPIRPSYWGILHSDVEEDIRDLAGFISVEKYAGQTATVEGEIGVLQNTRFISTSEASIDADVGGAPGSTLRSTGGSLADLYTTVIMGQDAHGSVSLDTSLISEVYRAGDDVPGIILIRHERGSAGTGDPLNEASSLGWKTWHAPVLLNSDWIRGARTAATVLQ